MKRTIAALCSLAALALACAASFATVSAAPSSVRMVQSNWYWQAQPSSITGTAGSRTDAPDPTVPAGDLTVAGPTASGGAQKETYLQFDVSVLPADALITSFTINLPVDPSPSAVTATNGTAPPIVACAVTQPWSSGPGGESFNGKPADDCSGAVGLKADTAGTTYSADVAKIAQRWLARGSVNTGLAITDDPNNSMRPYQVDFGPSAALQHLTANVVFTAAASSATTTVAAVPATTTTGTSVSSGSSLSRPAGDSAPAPAVLAPAAKPPAVAAPSAASGSDFPADMIPAGLVLLAALGASSLVLGARAVETGGRPGERARNLRDWRRLGSP